MMTCDLCSEPVTKELEIDIAVDHASAENGQSYYCEKHLAAAVARIRTCNHFMQVANDSDPENCTNGMGLACVRPYAEDAAGEMIDAEVELALLACQGCLNDATEECDS